MGPGMKFVICDDEALYRQLLHEKILQDAFRYDYEAEIVAYGSGKELVEAVSADVFFLDIQMEGESDDGIKAARELRRMGINGLIVYITSFIDYVQTGYEVKAFRYLLKSQIAEKLPRVLEDIRQELTDKDYFFHTGGERIRVDRRRILYLESVRRQLHLITTDKEYYYYGGLDQAQRELGEGFLRCHRSYLINLQYLRSYKHGMAYMEGGREIPVSRLRSREFSGVILQYMKHI